MAHVATPSRARRILAAVAAAIAALTAVGAVILWPGDVEQGELADVASVGVTADAEVLRVVEGACAGSVEPSASPCQIVTIKLTSGDEAGREAAIEFPVGSPLGEVSEGDTIIVARSESEGTVRYSFVERDRKSILLLLSIAFALAVIALGRLRGALALVGLIGSVLVILRFILPAVLQGTSPMLVAVVGSSMIAFLALYLAHGFRPLTNVALLGTISSLAITLILSEVFTGLANFTGFSSEEAFLVSLGAGQVDLQGLILAGVIIGALGAIDDITVTQASTVSELLGAASLSRRELFGSAMRVGRDHVASTVNTLFLAYAGASLPLLLLFVLTGRSFASVANSEVIAVEIVRTLVGSIGLVTAVPITTALAVLSFERMSHNPAPPASDGAEQGSGVGQPDTHWMPERRLDLWRRGRRRKQP